MAAKKSPKKTTRRRGITLKPTELTAADLVLGELDAELESLKAGVESNGGKVIGAYREPLGGHSLLLVALPIDRVEPTPFQRDVSDAHLRKLTRAMDKTRRYLDPIIVVAAENKYQTPNGNHRLTALKDLGAKAIIGLLVPDATVARQILALNVEKAHNLRERALEVVRLYRDLQKFSDEKEKAFEVEFDEPALVTLGFAYEERPRFAGGAYASALGKVDAFFDLPLDKAAERRTERRDLLLALDDAVNEAVARLKEKGLTSPYLKSFVVGRVNPLRFIKGDPPSFEELLATMTKRAKGLKVDSIGAQDLAKSGGPSEEG
jgi:ParB family transcriptional regulator, chromosome partitioning protein